MSDRLIDSMADDLGVLHIKGEAHGSFEDRTLFSALRYWMMAYALDDGFGGAYGVSGKTIIRKAARWLGEMTGMYPASRFVAGPAGIGIINVMLEGMLTVGDLARTHDGTIRCIEGHIVTFAPGMAAIVGFSDPTDRQSDSVFLSGAVMISSSNGEPSQTMESARKAVRPIVPRLKELDRFHSRLMLNTNITALPSPYRRWLEMVSWPDYGHGENGRNRVIRRGLEGQCRWLLAGKDNP